MNKKKLVFVALAALCALIGTVRLAYAQVTTTTDMSWFSWNLLITYAAVGAFFGLVHDVNDGKGLIVLPHKTAQNTWDLGIVTPAIFGAAAGFMSLAVQNVPFLQGLFPAVNGSGYVAAAFAGYFYSKTIEVVFAKYVTTPTPTPAPAAPAMPS